MLPILLRNRLKIKPTLKLNKREKTLGIIIISLLLVLLFYNKVSVAQMKQINTLAAEKAQKQALIKDYRQRGYADVIGLVAEKNQIEQETEKLYQEVPGYIGEPEILVDIHQLVDSCNLYADTITFQKYQEEAGFGRLPVTLTIKGPQFNIYQFIDRLEKSKRLVRVAAVEFTPADADWVTCNLTADFYVLGTPQQDPNNYDFLQDKYGVVPSYEVIKPTIDALNNGNAVNSGEQPGDNAGRAPELNNVQASGSAAAAGDNPVNRTGGSASTGSESSGNIGSQDNNNAGKGTDNNSNNSEGNNIGKLNSLSTTGIPAVDK